MAITIDGLDSRFAKSYHITYSYKEERMEGNTITRADLAEFVNGKIGVSQSEAAELVDMVLEEVVRALEKGEMVKLSSFGTFKIRQKKQRVGRNPKTKQEVPISPRKVVSFHASSIFSKKVNE